ncbi:MAG: hypothetical protein EXS05_13145 [Planctomycetaceae bacterium]|nr:hypothetical protein [Planctomycetaceae bacterium]
MLDFPGAAAASEAPETFPQDAATAANCLVLEVTRGQTRFRRRPVTSRRFLIGASVTCDLRLGGEGMPALHSLVVIDGFKICLEAIAPLPALRVNGQTVRETQLHDGDVIGIGEVELLARVSPAKRPAQVQASETTNKPSAPVTVLSEFSALELIERIEAEQRQISQFEDGRTTGVTALREAVQARSQQARADRQQDAMRARVVPAPHFLGKRAPKSAEPLDSSGGSVAPSKSADDSLLRNELEQLGRQLEVLSQELREGSRRSHDRDSSYAAMSDTLLDTQHKLVQQLEGLLSQVENLHQGQPATQRSRAIA